jgi:hypothetical protein
MSIVSSEFLCDVSCEQKGSQRPLYNYQRAKLGDNIIQAMELLNFWEKEGLVYAGGFKMR